MFISSGHAMSLEFNSAFMRLIKQANLFNLSDQKELIESLTHHSER